MNVIHKENAVNNDKLKRSVLIIICICQFIFVAMFISVTALGAEARHEGRGGNVDSESFRRLKSAMLIQSAATTVVIVIGLALIITLGNGKPWIVALLGLEAAIAFILPAYVH